MRVLIKEPGERWKLTDVRNTLEGLQGAVGGYIETVPVVDGVVILCDEDGIAKGLEENMMYRGHRLLGTLLCVRVDGSEFCDIPDWMERYVRRYE